MGTRQDLLVTEDLDSLGPPQSSGIVQQGVPQVVCGIRMDPTTVQIVSEELHVVGVQGVESILERTEGVVLAVCVCVKEISFN